MRGLGAYRTVLATPGAARLVAASLPARLSFGLFDLALVLLIERATGSFAAAGLAIGLHAVGVAVTAPLRGRLLDHFGARRVLPPIVIVNAASIAALPLAGGVLLALFTGGAVAGAALYGAREWRGSALRRLPPVFGIYAVALAALALPHSIALFGALLLVAGAPSAAQWATAQVALDEVTPPGQGAEGATWLSSANAAGIAAGGFMAGVLVEGPGTDTAFLAGSALAVVAALLVLARA